PARTPGVPLRRPGHLFHERAFWPSHTPRRNLEGFRIPACCDGRMILRGLSSRRQISVLHLFEMKISDPSQLLDVPKLIEAYYARRPDPSIPAQRVSFGTSGHRGSAFTSSFNEWHVLAISQAICRYRSQQGIDGPLFLGIDTHAVSGP